MVKNELSNGVDKLFQIGTVKSKGDVCLGVRLNVVTKFNLPDGTVLDMVGLQRDGYKVTALYKPKDGWKKSEQAEEMK